MTNQPLPPMPARIAKLPRDHRGFPIPWFVAELANGERDFRVADSQKRQAAIRRRLCWVCGETLGKFQAFVIGPMCVVNRVTSEPPCHLECAIFSACACPFLLRPRMRRNHMELPPGAVDPAGHFIQRNPGVTCIYVTLSYRTFRVADDWLIKFGDPSDVRWYSEGRLCGREPVLASIDSGYPILLELAEQEGAAAVAELVKHRDRAMRLLPAQ